MTTTLDPNHRNPRQWTYRLPQNSVGRRIYSLLRTPIACLRSFDSLLPRRSGAYRHRPIARLASVQCMDLRFLRPLVLGLYSRKERLVFDSLAYLAFQFSFSYSELKDIQPNQALDSMTTLGPLIVWLSGRVVMSQLYVRLPSTMRQSFPMLPTL